MAKSIKFQNIKNRRKHHKLINLADNYYKFIKIIIIKYFIIKHNLIKPCNQYQIYLR